MKLGEKRRVVPVYVSGKLHARLMDFCQEHGLSASALLRFLAQDYLRAEEAGE